MEGVRPAIDDDLARLAELARAAIAELTPMKGGVVWAAREARPEPVEESLKASLADDDTRVVLGTIDDVAIGYVRYSFRLAVESWRDCAGAGSILRERGCFKCHLRKSDYA